MSAGALVLVDVCATYQLLVPPFAAGSAAKGHAEPDGRGRTAVAAGSRRAGGFDTLLLRLLLLLMKSGLVRGLPFGARRRRRRGSG